MLNKVLLQGRIAKDITVRYTQNSIAVAGFALAVEQDFSGEGKKRGVDFIGCTAWKKTAEVIGKYCSKGDMIIVQGRINQKKYEDTDGAQKSKLDVNVESFYFAGDSKKKSGSADAQQNERSFNGEDDFQPTMDFNEEDLPF